MSEEVQIPSCTATQIVGDSRIPFATGTLTLRPSPLTQLSHKLILSVQAAGKSALTLPLNADAVVGTTGPRTYLFTIPTVDGDTGVVLEVVLPPTVDDTRHADNAAALALEEMLVEHGFLNTGLVADADDAARALQEGAAKVAGRVGGYVDWRVGRSMGVEKEYGEGTKRRVHAAVDGSQKAAEATGRATEAVAGVAEGAGEWVGAKVGGGGGGERSLPGEALKQGVEATGVLAGGVAGAVGKVGGSVGEGASRVAEAEKGPEAKELVDGGREVAGNVGKVGVDLVTGTSVVWHAGEAGVAAAKSGTADK
ncbi:hypothetical protein EDC01DRAFT_780880 [Geopyxis carbonaria]|nr:hypothetical protein EDC01DRAFT_780880 [Geopyxis carbonaria]